MRYLISLFCCFLTFSAFAEEQSQEELILSTPDQLAALTCEPDFLVGGLISPMGGHPALWETDLVVQGAQKIPLTRIYIPPYMPLSFPKHKRCQEEYEKKHLYFHLVKNYQGWQFFPHTKLQYHVSRKEARFSEPNGAIFDFKISTPKTTLASPPYAISNIAGDEPHGKYDPRNTHVSYENQGNQIIVYAADGAVRFYNKKQGSMRTGYQLYLLDKEVLPHGKILRYRYDDKVLSCVESLDPQERYVYASLNISGSSEREGRYHFASSSGASADYGYERRPYHAKIKDKKYKLETWGTHPPILNLVETAPYQNDILDYCDRFLLKSYAGKNQTFTAQYKGFGDEPHYRVNKLSLPVGENDAFQPVYELDYDPAIPGEKEGSTCVKNSDGTSIIYRFSKDFLVNSIEYFGQDGSLKKKKSFSWDGNQWLKSIELKDGQQNFYYKKSYEYDSFGNPTVEIFSGDLTGSGLQESIAIRREFSQDGRHLLLKEEYDNGKSIHFSYLPTTNLITVKLTKDHGQIFLRDFFYYDDCNNLIQKISDDGNSLNPSDLSGITQRTIINYILRQQQPFLHMPEWIEEKYVDQGAEKLLKRKHLIYDAHGNVAQEEIYDAENNLAYVIKKEYNERGDLLSETNSLGQKAAYGYDSRGHCNSETNFSGRLQKTMRYDAQGRLREEEEIGDNGTSHETFFEYDFHDRLIERKDHFDNSTHYNYDPLVSKVVRTDFPAVASVDGEPVAVATSSSYDPFGCETTQTDANGNITSYRYNAYGSCVEIVYPDGSKEFFRYAKNGSLLSHTDQEGLVVNYTRDLLGRELSKTYVSSNGDFLTEEKFTYSSFHLLSKTDKEGNVTKYQYDEAGRKIREDHAGHITDFGYDSLGRLSTICKHNGDKTLIIHYKKDLEGRLLEETKTDVFGNTFYKISYTYDEDGNKATVNCTINGEKSVESLSYDPFGRLVEQRDPNFFVTTRSYHEDYINSLGQRVLQKTIIDPCGIATLETRDALNRAVKKDFSNPEGVTLSSVEKIYDAHGNLTHQKDHRFENGQFQSTQMIKYTYTPTHHIESLTKAFRGENASTTTYTHSPSGKIATKTLADGITLSYEYHPLGFLSRLSSSDDTILHTFEYNNLGHLKYAADEKLNISIKRKVDPFGNVTQELFPSAPAIDKEYDDFNRLVSMKISGIGEVSYQYDPLFLRTVTRSSNDGKMLYTHQYEDYDLYGNLLSEKLIAGLGKVTHTTNLKGQKTSIFSSYFSQNCSYDPTGNLIENVIDQTDYRYAYDDLSQLTSEKSASQSSDYLYDSLYNRIQKDSKINKINDLNQLLSSGDKLFSYDLNGNQTTKQTPLGEFQLSYDPLNRLVEATSPNKKIHFSYDPLGRCLNKTIYTMNSSWYTFTPSGWQEKENENYLYHDNDEIGAFVSQQPKNFRVLGLNKQKNPLTIAIELKGKPFAPILDIQGNIRGLINPNTGLFATKYQFTAFGEELKKNRETAFNPWRYASKRFDPELGLIDFGKRFYDPQLGRWLTTDPAGFIDSANLYQYVFNNPFLYRDPDGQLLWFLTVPLLIWGSEVAAVSLSVVATQVAYTALTAAATYVGCKVVKAVNNRISINKSMREYLNDMENGDDEDNNSREDRGGQPPNAHQNPQFRAAASEVGKRIGRRLSQKEERQFHDHVTGQGYNYHEMVQEGYWLFYRH